LEGPRAEKFVELRLGDDQDTNGPGTGYKIWEPKLWKALGIDNIETRLNLSPSPTNTSKPPLSIFGGPSLRVLSTIPLVHSPE